MFIEQNDITSTHDTSPGLYFCDVLVVVYSYTAVPYCYQRIPQIHLVWIQTMSEWKCAFCFPNLTKQFLLSQHTIIGHNTKKSFVMLFCPMYWTVENVLFSHDQMLFSTLLFFPQNTKYCCSFSIKRNPRTHSILSSICHTHTIDLKTKTNLLVS